jgi:hypothetical protein
LKTIYPLLFILGIVLNFSDVFSQIQFQKQYGDGYKIRSLTGIINEPGQTTIAFCTGSNFDSFHIPSHLSLGFYNVNTNDSICHFIELHDLNYDTNYNYINVRKDSDDNFIVCGSSFIGNQTISCISIIDSNFDFLLGNSFDFGGINYFKKMVDAGNKENFLLGIISGPSSYYANFICKLDSNLNLLWSKNFETQSDYTLRDMCMVSDGSLIACGSCMDSGDVNYSILILKIDTTGNLIWSKKYKTQKMAYSYNIVPLKNSFTICGQAWDSTNNVGTALIMNLNMNGDINFIKKYISSASAQSRFIHTSDNGYLISCLHAPGVEGSLIKIDSLGVIQWNHYYPNSNNNHFLVENEQGGFLSLGIITMDSIWMYLIKTDTSGFSGCLESNFPISVSNENNFTVSNLPIVVTNSNPTVQSFFLTKDTSQLYLIDRCNSINSITELGQPIKGDLIFPNPSKGKVSFQNIDYEFDFFIYNSTGNLIFENYKCNSESKFFFKFPDGIYFYKVVSDIDRHENKGKILVIN